MTGDELNEIKLPFKCVDRATAAAKCASFPVDFDGPHIAPVATPEFLAEAGARPPPFDRFLRRCHVAMVHANECP
jgi:hypothetical protein